VPAAINSDVYTPSQVAAVTGLPLPAVHKAIEHKLIRPKLVREGNSVQRLLSRSQALYLRMEAQGLRSLPLAERRQVARAIQQNPGIDAVFISEGSVIVIQCKAARCTRGLEFLSTPSPICCRRVRRWRTYLKAIPRSLVRRSNWRRCTSKHFRAGGVQPYDHGPSVRRDASAIGASQSDEVSER
jgi:hypothetical protein